MAFARASLNPQRLLRTFVSTPHQTLRRGHWRIVNPGTSNALPSGSDLMSPKVAEAMHALEEIEKFSQKHGIDVDVALKAKVDAELVRCSGPIPSSGVLILCDSPFLLLIWTNLLWNTNLESPNATPGSATAIIRALQNGVQSKEKISTCLHRTCMSTSTSLRIWSLVP